MFKSAVLAWFLSAMVFSYVFAGEFDDFVRQQEEGSSLSQSDFEQYKQDIENEFDSYKKIVDEEYERYKKGILKYWHVAEISDKKKWVEYSPDFKTKKIVDFENELIELDIISSKNEKEIEEAFNSLLTDLILEDKQTAFQRDTLSQNIEKRVKEDTKHVKTDTVEKAPILTTVITGTPKPTKKQIEQAVSDLRKKGKIETRQSKVKHAEVVSLKIPLPPKSILKKAREYRPVVTDFAGKRKLDGALVFAVIHTESAFNPMARSYVPAYGLMQIVPRSGGKDASEFVFGRPLLLSPSFLYNAKNNINMGTAYLHLLSNKYFKKIEDPESRLYCAIAAYNTGPGNVARTFVGKKNIERAVAAINKMTPGEVYYHLTKNLPYEETRHYLKRVARRIEAYRTMTDKG